LAELPIRELAYGFGEAMQLAAKNGRGAVSASGRAFF
jgi:hypothetical protein